ncbi:unnamed protein product [Paramecium sonneborni]|uniref:Transmembrane protein n=1 Tax=Paramecium sonneborni TaxID=65129 RepID=A0A8S1MQP4_9CILI|nr:unnamed protein product [Paramecium sonneborni]
MHYWFEIKPVFALILLYGLVFTLFKTFLRALQIKAFFKVTKDLKQLELKIQVFREFQKTNQIVNKIGDLIYFGHIYHHLANKCRNQYSEFGMRCFCTMKITFDSKLQKDIRKTIQAIRNHRSSFTKLMIKSLYETLIQGQQKDIELRFVYAQFLYFKMKNKIQAYEQIMQIKNKRMSIHLQLRMALMSSIAKENVNDLNSLAYHSFLDFEQVVDMEETVSYIYQVIIRLLSLYSSFWRRLNRNQQVEEIQIEINKDIDQEIKNCNKLWKNLIKHEVRVKQQDVIISFLNKRLKWKFVYFWYRLFILNKKIRLTQIESISSATLHQEIVNEDSDSDYDIKAYEQFNSSKPFNHMSLIIHSLLNGQILRCSQSCKELLEFDNLKSISQLIPEVLQRNHQNAIKQLLYYGKSRTLYKSRKIFVRHAQGYVIQARKYLKWSLDQSNQINFITMIRPIIRLEQINYIILNGDWEVDAVTKPLFKVLDQKICLLLLCTGLFQFSKFAHYLDSDDITRFKLTQKSRSLNMTQSKFYNQIDSINQNNLTNSQKAKVIEKQQMESDDQLFTFFGEDNIEYFNTDNTFTNKRIFKMVDEQHVKLTLRIPRKIHQLSQEYEQLKISTFQDAIQQTGTTNTLYKQKTRLIFRNNDNKIKINKLLLFRRLYDFNQRVMKIMFDNLKDLFDKYCSQNRLLEKIIKLDATILFTKTISMDKSTIIKINKYEIFEYHQRQFRETHNVLAESRMKQSRPTLVEIYMDPRIFGIHQQVNNSEVDSNRIDQNKSFLTEGQIFPEFVQYHPTEVTLKHENNIFFKQDNNKVSKNIKEMSFFIFFNRIMIFTLYLLAGIAFVKGPSLTQHAKIYSEIQQLQQISRLSLCIIQTYEYALDIYLFDQQNSTDIDMQHYLQQKSNLLQQQSQFINESLKGQEFIEILFGYQMLDQPISDLVAQFMAILNQWHKSDWQVINSQFNMLDEFRSIIIPHIQSGLLDCYSQQYNNQMNRLMEYQQFAIFEIVITICLTLFFVIANQCLILNVIKKNQVFIYLKQTIIKSFHLLSKQQIATSIQYIAWLKLQLKFLIDLETMKFLNQKTTQISNCDVLTKYDNQEQINNSEVDSNRIDQNKSFLTEGQIFPEFVQYHPTEVTLKHENNIFFKQDNNKVSKNIKEMSFFIFFNRIMIFTLYLLAGIAFVKGPSLTQHAKIYSEIQQLQQISRLSLCIIQTYEYALDIYLFDQQNSTDIDMQHYLQQKSNLLQQQSQFINESLKGQEFIEILFGYQMLDQPISDLVAQFMAILNQWHKSDWQVINSQFNMLDEFRSIIIPHIQSGLLDCYSQQYNNQMNRLMEYQQFAIFEIVITICLTLFFVIANQCLILNVIKKNQVFIYLKQTIIKSFHLLSKQQIATSIQYIAWLKLQLKFLIDLETMKFLNQKTTQISNCDVLTKYDNQEQSVQINTKTNSYIGSNHWLQIKVTFMMYYFLSSMIISSFFFYYLVFLQDFQSGALSIFNENQFVKNPHHLYSMVSIKELYIYQYINNSNQFIKQIKQNVEKFIDQIDDESNEIYQTNIDEVFQMFYGNYCELLLELSPNTTINEYDQCKYKLSGAFTRGLNQYYLLLSQIALSLINPNDTRYDQPNINTIFEFSEVQENAYEIEQLTLKIWCDQYFIYADDEMYLDILLMQYICQ